MLEHLTFLKPLRLEVFGLYEKSNKQLLQPLAWTDAFLRSVNNHDHQMIVHFWPMSNVVILGMQDRKTPFFDQGLATIQEKHYQPIIRNIGGLCVVSDEGILNFSLILPNANLLSINEAYFLMVDLIIDMFKDYSETIEHYEIVHSYCPGTFDLSIKGQKFAGIAQRRIKNGVAISIYMSVYGDQLYRGKLVKEFYEKAIQGEKTTIKYPDVNPTCMSNLTDLLGEYFTINDVQNRLLNSLQNLGLKKHQLHLDEPLLADYKKFLAQHQKRNQSIITI